MTKKMDVLAQTAFIPTEAGRRARCPARRAVRAALAPRRRAAARRLLEQRPERLRLEQAAPRAARPRGRAPRRSLCLRAELAARATRREALAQLDDSGRASRRSAGRRAAARSSRSRCSPGGGTRRRSARPGGSGRAARRGRRRSRSRPGRPRVADAEAEVLALAHRRQVVQLAAGDQQVDAGVAEPERREPAQLGAEAERERRAGNDRVDRGHRPQVVVGQVLVGVGGEGLGERRRRSRGGSRGRRRRGGRRSARGAPSRRRGRRAGRRRDRTAAALPVAFRARDQDDGAVVALDQPRGDDPDHALVPVLAGDDVAAAAAAGLRPRLDRGARLAQDALLDRLALAVQLLELERDPARPPPRRRSAAARARRSGGRDGRRR